MIGQLMAVSHPERVVSLVSIMSTTGNRRVGRPRPRMALRTLRKVPRDRAGYIEDHIETYRMIGSKGFDFDEQHKRAHEPPIAAGYDAAALRVLLGDIR